MDSSKEKFESTMGAGSSMGSPWRTPIRTQTPAIFYTVFTPGQ